MSMMYGNATQRRLEVTLRRKAVEKRAARDARRLAGIPEPRPPYRPHKPYKTSGRDHKTFYGVKVQVGFIAALLITIGFLHAPIRQGPEVFDVTLGEQELIAMEEITQTRQDVPPPPPPRPPVPVAVADDLILEDEELNLDATLEIDDFLADIPPPPVQLVSDVEEEEPEIFVVVEEAPVMIGGLAALARELRYPDLARKAGVEGRVTVQFVVDENGTVLEPVVLRGIGAGCDEEAIRVISQMKFEPGRQRGRAVKVRMATSVNFRLT